MDLEEDLDIETGSLKFTDREIFTEIWTSPRLVFKYLNDARYDKFVNVLLVFAGIAKGFDRASLKNMGDNIPLIGVLAICILLGGLFGWISYYIYAAMISWTGNWMGAKGNTSSLLRMISHAMIPSLAGLIFLIPQIVIFGNEIFQSEDVYGSGFQAEIIGYVFYFIDLSLLIWTLVLIVIGISEVQKLSIGKSILNMFLPALVILVPLAIIAFMLGDLFGH